MPDGGVIGCSQKANDQFVVSEETELYGLANPFDIVGEMHNEGLDFIFSSMQTKSQTLSEEEIEMLADEFCEKVFSENDFFYLDPSITKSVADQDYEEEEVELSEKAENYISQIISITESNDYELISTTFLTMESEILNSESDSLSEYEKNLILCTLAVGKYSNEYWKEYTMDTTKSRSAVGEVVGADVYGALRGMWAKKIEIVVCAGFGGIGMGLAAAGRAALGPALACSAGAGAAAIGGALL